MTEETKNKRGRRKVAAEEVSSVAVAVDESPSGPPPVPMLTQEELFKIQLYQAEAARAIAEAETCRMRKKWILALIDPKNTVEAEEKRLEKLRDEAKDFYKKYETTKARASMRLNLDLSMCGFDAETGVIHLPDSAKGTT